MRAQHVQYFNLEYSVIGLPESVRLLKPSIFKQGDQWCVSYAADGNEYMLYAETPELAILAFDEKYKDKRNGQGN